MTEKNSTSHGYNDLDMVLPKTATKPIVAAKKRGRPGKLIAIAFKEIPETPVNFDEYCDTHGIQTTVLRQIKRHDTCPETGRAFVRKNTDKKSEAYGTMQIWRDHNQVSPWLPPKDK